MVVDASFCLERSGRVHGGGQEFYNGCSGLRLFGGKNTPKRVDESGWTSFSFNAGRPATLSSFITIKTTL
jgi:hypothetical protein